ncbi:AAA family ATPase [Microcoleus sp. LAD1_D1]|uniref:AAA family ATPase n=1 Tax=Microcoleus sp. LAD1_D1 TaxID=2818812 RepID=UPI002FCE826D
MRDARAADWLRRLRGGGNAWPNRITRLTINDLSSLGSLDITISSPFTVLSGANGAGKTTVLRALWAALDPDKALSVIAADLKFTTGATEVELRHNESNCIGKVLFGTAGMEVESRQPVPVQHVDSGATATVHQREFCKFQNVDEIVNGVGAFQLDEASLAEVRFINSRQYKSLRLYEVDLGEVAPFFEVEYGGERYDSRTMGAGEISALYIWWAVRRAEENSAVLIEEPEAFLSYNAQKNLFRSLVSYAVRKKLIFVVSSHSPAFMNDLPSECLVFLARSTAGVAVISDPPPPVLLKEIGIDPPIKAFVFVEDQMAKIFFRTILEKIDPFLSRQIHIEHRNGDGGVISALTPMLGVTAPVRFVALFDGDLRGKIPQDIVPQSSFLPGDRPIEQIFRALVELDTNGFASAVGNPNCSAILSSLEGRDHHDWYNDLARELGLSSDQLFSHLFHIWWHSSQNESLASQAYNDVANILARI